MGVMIDGRYHAEDPGPDTTEGGAFKRAASTIRGWITAEGPHPPEAGRYHLYAAWNCPWAHRALLGRAVLGLEEAISVSFALPRRTEDGWVFETEGAFSDTEFGAKALHEVYARQHPAYTGRITVPVLWDRHAGVIVSNESADILRMLNSFVAGEGLYPARHAAAIERWNAEIYPKLNNGVYRAGFARTQDAHDAAVAEVFEMLDRLDGHLEGKKYLCGEDLTEADLRLFPTLARFDVAYHYAFKCNIRRLCDYGPLWAYARRLYARPEIAATVRFDIYKQGYFSPSPLRNPLGIVPAGPEIDWST
ncbi:glutathione S-transferase family protein [Pseudoruegeria sp. SHC-113]|uniref:glutathione S-transferase family protein n=1 Tax=Pseudoruegeria sp. SHC-113 TaxID=2855439 RepID=UPI0021BB6D7E|nr:glutathione S-transferase C-terminal domain-containing protein [Pseudoruegeria sp. SHC-113]MCT8158481.1 glutathione S-transferase C-terminal domain-containing protein [Pseudoruegeria sp. SHC-113]